MIRRGSSQFGKQRKREQQLYGVVLAFDRQLIVMLMPRFEHADGRSINGSVSTL